MVISLLPPPQIEDGHNNVIYLLKLKRVFTMRLFLFTHKYTIKYVSQIIILSYIKKIRTVMKRSFILHKDNTHLYLASNFFTTSSFISDTLLSKSFHENFISLYLNLFHN